MREQRRIPPLEGGPTSSTAVSKALWWTAPRSPSRCMPRATRTTTTTVDEHHNGARRRASGCWTTRRSRGRPWTGCCRPPPPPPPPRGLATRALLVVVFVVALAVLASATFPAIFSRKRPCSSSTCPCRRRRPAIRPNRKRSARGEALILFVCSHGVTGSRSVAGADPSEGASARPPPPRYTDGGGFGFEASS